MSKFNEGDNVLAIADAVGAAEIVRGAPYIVAYADGHFVSLEGVRGFYQESLFVLDDQPELYSEDDILEDALGDAIAYASEEAADVVDYIMEEIEDCIVSGVQDDYDRGYLDALRNLLEELYGHRPEVGVTFVPVENA